MSAIPSPGRASTVSERHLAGSRFWYPAWAWPSFGALLLITFVLYVWGLDRNGWANAYYAAAVQAGTQSWKAFFFGSLDASNFILTSGSSQGLSLAAAAFVDPGDGAIVESLTYAYALHSLRLRGADVRMAEIDEDGLVIESLEQRLSEYREEGIRP